MSETLLTNVGAAFLYREARFASESVSQSLLGESVEVVDRSGDWIRIKQHDGYAGWISKFFMVPKPDGWDAYEHFSPQAKTCMLYESPDISSNTIRDMTMISKLPIVDRQHGWTQLLLPDGQKAWTHEEPRHVVHQMDVEDLVATAFMFQGLPYFWGGRSPKGFDCSGFVQTVFALNGFQLPRDAYLQADIGVEVVEGAMQSQAGDLIYFSESGKKITHVALALGAGDFIHSSGFVKLNSLNPEHTDLYIERYANIYTKTMRVI